MNGCVLLFSLVTLLFVYLIWLFAENEKPCRVVYGYSVEKANESSSSSLDDSLLQLRFVSPSETSNVPCSQFFNPNIDVTSLGKKFRTKYEDPSNEKDLPTDCNSILERNNFHRKPLSKEENKFPLAYARNVFQDYRFLEITLSTTYAPQNFYCFSIDGKANKLFRQRMNNLAKCFPNVHITDFTAKMDSAGHNTNAHHMACLKWLADKNKKWKYVMLLQNHDIPLKTNQEMVQILKWYNGTNDVTTELRNQLPKHSWDFETLRLFKDPARNKQTIDGNKPEVLLTRSMVQNFMSREAIDFIIDKLNLDITVQQLNSYSWTVDEYLTSSLNSNDNIKLPGGFTRKCGSKSGTIIGMSRFNVWIRNRTRCGSGMWRHNVCIFGLEDLRSNFVDNPFFIANKMYPAYDFAAITCWNEVLFNRTYYDRGLHRLNKAAYVNLPQVRYNRARNKYGDKFNIDLFNCSAYSDQHIGTNILSSGIRIIESKKKK
ncbi:hypothetical protein M3Y97_00001400 [Aphelenchoides bicaudatus]|nr:hypothetical protein M3Y97_00001400 [Aphelenchoides bicaudatus]